MRRVGGYQLELEGKGLSGGRRALFTTEVMSPEKGCNQIKKEKVKGVYLCSQPRAGGKARFLGKVGFRGEWVPAEGKVEEIPRDGVGKGGKKKVLLSKKKEAPSKRTNAMVSPPQKKKVLLSKQKESTTFTGWLWTEGEVVVLRGRDFEGVRAANNIFKEGGKDREIAGRRGTFQSTM